ncbi:hypothetical protein E2C01_035977 [Portunus trituberculatus]|uniref:Uncharacterized protein n=1 Tax=Portunus trituberculatus TaxID=210409 RepID=A0A5B7FAL4_PORTR|nr:hypothetical protein [Portunus trituberculatus]
MYCPLWGLKSLDRSQSESCYAPLTPLVLSLCHGIQVLHPPQDMAAALNREVKDITGQLNLGASVAYPFRHRSSSQAHIEDGS